MHELLWPQAERPLPHFVPFWPKSLRILVHSFQRTSFLLGWWLAFRRLGQPCAQRQRTQLSGARCGPLIRAATLPGFRSFYDSWCQRQSVLPLNSCSKTSLWSWNYTNYKILFPITIIDKVITTSPLYLLCFSSRKATIYNLLKTFKSLAHLELLPYCYNN